VDPDIIQVQKRQTSVQIFGAFTGYSTTHLSHFDVNRQFAYISLS